jgi:hypothetical protein
MNNTLREVLFMMNGFSNEGILPSLSRNAIESLHRIAEENSVKLAIMILVRAYVMLRDDRTFDEFYSGSYFGYIVICKLTKNRIFEVWVIN